MPNYAATACGAGYTLLREMHSADFASLCFNAGQGADGYD